MAGAYPRRAGVGSLDARERSLRAGTRLSELGEGSVRLGTRSSEFGEALFVSGRAPPNGRGLSSYRGAHIPIGKPSLAWRERVSGLGMPVLQIGEGFTGSLLLSLFPSLQQIVENRPGPRHGIEGRDLFFVREAKAAHSAPYSLPWFVPRGATWPFSTARSCRRGTPSCWRHRQAHHRFRRVRRDFLHRHHAGRTLPGVVRRGGGPRHGEGGLSRRRPRRASGLQGAQILWALLEAYCRVTFVGDTAALADFGFAPKKYTKPSPRSKPPQSPSGQPPARRAARWERRRSWRSREPLRPPRPRSLRLPS